ncbi:MAG: 3-hydroxyacyl-ACP dehydratase FabZ [Sulfobacillus sp.]
MSINVRDRLPHRPPFLLVDRVLEVEDGKRARTQKCVAENEPFLAGHFPGLPVMPGVLLVEAIAQAAAIAVSQAEGTIGLLAGIDQARFRRPVRPGDVVVVDAEILSLRHNMGKAHGMARVDGEVVAEATILFAIRPRTDLG